MNPSLGFLALVGNQFRRKEIFIQAGGTSLKNRSCVASMPIKKSGSFSSLQAMLKWLGNVGV